MLYEVITSNRSGVLLQLHGEGDDLLPKRLALAVRDRSQHRFAHEVENADVTGSAAPFRRLDCHLHVLAIVVAYTAGGKIGPVNGEAS